VKKTLSPEDFFRPEHRYIAEGIYAVGGEPILVEEYLTRKNLLHKAGGRENLNTLWQTITTSAGIEHFARILKELSNRRKIIRIAQNAIDQAHVQDNDLNTVFSTLKSELRAIETEQPQNCHDSKSSILAAFKEIEVRSKSNFPFVGVKTGFENIDNQLHGLEPQTTIYTIARPSIGKTALGLNIAENVALAGQAKVLYFALESNHVALSRRRLACRSGIFLTRLRTGNIEDSQWQDLIDAANVLTKSNLIIIDKPRYKAIENLAALSESLAEEHPLGLIIIDHIQRCRSTKRLQNRHLELSHVSEELSSIAKELNVPIIIMCQLSRAVEHRRNQKPRLADMKESGDLEANADVVLSLYRETMESEILEVECLKGRDTGTWRTTLRFNRYTQKIDDCDEDPKSYREVGSGYGL
jgi:replicative DNA helicase